MTKDELLLLECYGAIHYMMGLFDASGETLSLDWPCDVVDAVEARLKGESE